MFDIGFLELLVVLVIALLVIGPERMPELAKKLGQFMGKMRRFVNSMKEEGQVQETIREIKDAMDLEEEKHQINNIGKELEQGLNYNDINLDELQRPFGGEALPSETSTGSQFNKAPAQPKAPTPSAEQTVVTPETTADTKTETKPTETTVSHSSETEQPVTDNNPSKS